jgi:hypothetical protein
MLCLLIPRKSRKSPQGHAGGFAFDKVAKGYKKETKVRGDFLPQQISTNLNNH